MFNEDGESRQGRVERIPHQEGHESRLSGPFERLVMLESP